MVSGEALEYIEKYLKDHVDDGIQLTPVYNQGFHVYCDADFAGNRNRRYAMTDPATVKSRSGWIISYANCPIIWASKLQTQVALSTTEAEYITIALSQSLQDTIPLLELVNELHSYGFEVWGDPPRLLNTTQELWSLQRFRRCGLAQCTLMCAIITFVRLCNRARLLLSMSPLRLRGLTTSPTPYLRMRLCDNTL